MVSKEISKNIRRLRKSKDLTQIEMANKLAISRSSYNRFETGNGQWSIDILFKISKLLNIDITELITIKTIKPGSDDSLDLKLKKLKKLIEKQINQNTEILKYLKTAQK